MPLPLRLRSHSLTAKIAAAVLIAGIATLIALGLAHAPGTSAAVRLLDNVLYDSMYRVRPEEDRTGGPVVIVAVDDASLKAVNDQLGFGWPWPRDFWGQMTQYFERAGAKAVAIDLLFTEKSVHAGELDDDNGLAAIANKAKVPIVFAHMAQENGKPGILFPPIESPRLGAANIGGGEVFRSYTPTVYGLTSFAAETVTASGMPAPTMPSEPFLLHFYGPYRRSDGKNTFRYLSAASVLQAMNSPEKAAAVGISDEMFRGKIVLIGTITAGTYDLKSSPLSADYPGVEVHATAIENLLAGQYVARLGAFATISLTLAAALLAAIAVTMPRRVSFKLIGALLAFLLLVCVAITLFRGQSIRWLPLASPIVAILLTTVGAFAWSYVTEDRARKLIFRALAQNTSPEMAAEIARNPDVLKLGGTRREMTVMFTDIAGFTTLSEKMDVEQLTKLMNFYLEEMSSIVLDAKGYLDKYIGDAIMSFWNGALTQTSHAHLACKTALAMRDREELIRPQLAGWGAPGLLTRIGINTGPMALGNMGSTLKFSYTVMGDSVNLASRLEGTNKVYGTRIIVAETTQQQVKDAFVLRRLDVMRVTGKTQPLAIYELIEEGQGDEATRERIRLYEAAFAKYQAQDWTEAEAGFEEVIHRFKEDPPSRAMIARVREMREHPPGADWDGVYVAKSK